MKPERGTILVHICEVCGVSETVDAQDAYMMGWDYPPGMGEYGIVSPRTCPDCPIDKTLYWRIITSPVETVDGETTNTYELIEGDKVILERILAEPESITP